MAARAEAGVSPLRTRDADRRQREPQLATAISAISRSGRSRFCCTSTASAFSGET